MVILDKIIQESGAKIGLSSKKNKFSGKKIFILLEY